MDNTVLIHWGKKGMKWGVRRYQNTDGSLTPAGKKRYARDASEKGFKDRDEQGVYYKTSGKKNKRTNLDVEADRYVKEDMTRSKRLAEETSGMASKLKQINDNSMRNSKRPKLDLSNMTDKQMRDEINRALLERQYNDVFNPPTVSKGKERASKILEGTVAGLGIVSSALGIALAIKELKG